MRVLLTFDEQPKEQGRECSSLRHAQRVFQDEAIKARKRKRRIVGHVYCDGAEFPDFLITLTPQGDAYVERERY
jgi:hypothetical protein